MKLKKKKMVFFLNSCFMFYTCISLQNMHKWNAIHFCIRFIDVVATCFLARINIIPTSTLEWDDPKGTLFCDVPIRPLATKRVTIVM
jgi:hypothetical protein